MPARLSGSMAALIPLDESHINELWKTAKDEKLWEHYVFRKMGSLEKFKELMMDAIEKIPGGKEFTFTIIDKSKSKMIGSTRFLDISPESRSLEIGWTWIARYLHGTGFNAECKYLLLKHCFEEMKAIRVSFKTDSNNIPSQKALENIGAKYEGILRNHMIRDDGTYRHSVYYSIIENEWESVKNILIKSSVKL